MAAGARCVLVRGTGGFFCAGRDLQDTKPGGEDTLDIIRRFINPSLAQVRNCPVPTIAAKGAPFADPPDPNDHAARLELAEALLGASDHEGAAAQYLELMRRSRAFGDDAGRQGLLKLFELLGNEHPVTGTFRRRMASLLY